MKMYLTYFQTRDYKKGIYYRVELCKSAQVQKLLRHTCVGCNFILFGDNFTRDSVYDVMISCKTLKIYFRKYNVGTCVNLTHIFYDIPHLYT